MKIYKLYLIMFIGLFLQSCLNEDPQLNESLQSDETLKNDQAVKLVTVSDGTSRRTYSFLSFKDNSALNKTIKRLELEAEHYDDQFIASYPNLSGEQLTEKELEVGFDHYRIFKNFINKHNFNNSMLNAFMVEEKNWLQNEFLDISNDPNSKYLDAEPEEMVVLNEDGVVQVGDTIYIQARNGYITIPNNNINGLFNYLDLLDFSGLGPININWNDVLGFGLDNFSNWYEELSQPTYNCSQDDRDKEWWHYNSTRKIKGLVKSHSSQWWGGIYLKSKTVYYRRFWFFGYHWIQTRSASLTAALDGTFAGNSCGDMYNHLYEDVNFKRKTNKYRVIYKLPGDTPFNITNNEMKGVHKKASWRREHYLR